MYTGELFTVYCGATHPKDICQPCSEFIYKNQEHLIPYEYTLKSLLGIKPYTDKYIARTSWTFHNFRLKHERKYKQVLKEREKYSQTQLFL